MERVNGNEKASGELCSERRLISMKMATRKGVEPFVPG
jgi:hypothetical protein